MASLRPKLSTAYRPATPAELDAAAVITPGDIAHAKVAWVNSATPALRQLLNATIEDPPEPRRRPPVDLTE